ncbi:helix-turn-helix domain-containing protein [Cryobacterium sp. PH29-G1]|uniref:helix-turn-helix domain-containing protein n=1 Tax=Cryobacterium sp. PH29-G1 TaxID=3046211 RepID=UPI0024B941F6|nr:helix-turn-helix domain-containing protein [Cryobacterium sp. PH29-G1]MDJ0349139.1 helix-turn-helix domain-containing protein [Cryobacterium sp. PH29-G1]
MSFGTIVITLEHELTAQGMTLTELSRRTGISTVNLSLLKNNHAKAIRFTTLNAICAALDCTPGDIIVRSPAVD